MVIDFKIVSKRIIDQINSYSNFKDVFPEMIFGIQTLIELYDNIVDDIGFDHKPCLNCGKNHDNKWNSCVCKECLNKLIDYVPKK